MDLFLELQELQKRLNNSVKYLKQYGTELAQAERDYKIALRQEALKLRTEKDMPVTLIQQVIYGYDDISKLRFERDTAEVKYNANQEYINTIKLQIRILESQLSREYAKG